MKIDPNIRILPMVCGVKLCRKFIPAANAKIYSYNTKSQAFVELCAECRAAKGACFHE